MKKCLAALASAFVLTGSSSSQQIHVVDSENASGTDFTVIQEAVNVALPGDTIVVRSGNYGRVTIDGKGLQMIGVRAEGPMPRLVRLNIRNVPAHEHVLISGFDISPDDLFGNPGLDLEGDAGQIRIKDLTVLGAVDILNSVPAAIRVQQCSHVFFQDVYGVALVLPGPQNHFFSHDALLAVDADIHFEDSVLVGGIGGSLDPAGGHAVALEDASLEAKRCEFYGGPGAFGIGIDGGGCIPPTDGGMAIEATLPRGVTLRNTFLFGGAGGAGPFGCAPAADGAPTNMGPGDYELVFGTAQSIEVIPPILTVGDMGEVRMRGTPGYSVIVTYATRPGYAIVPGFNPITLANPIQVVGSFATFDGLGLASIPINTVNIPVGLESNDYFLQALVLSPGLESVNFGASAWTIVFVPGFE